MYGLEGHGRCARPLTTYIVIKPPRRVCRHVVVLLPCGYTNNDISEMRVAQYPRLWRTENDERNKIYDAIPM